MPLLPHRGFPNPSSHRAPLSLAALPAPRVFNCDPWTTHVKVSLTHHPPVLQLCSEMFSDNGSEKWTSDLEVSGVEV